MHLHLQTLVAEPPVVDTIASYSSLELLLMVVVLVVAFFIFIEKHLPPIKYITKLTLVYVCSTINFTIEVIMLGYVENNV